MSDTSAPFGMNPIRHINGKFMPPPRAIPGGIASGYATDIFFGSPVKLTTSGTINTATTNEDFYGVFAGCQYVPNATSMLTPTNQWVASTTYASGSMVAYVWDDPNIIYEIQADGAIDQTGVGDQADFVNPGSGATTGGSTAMIDATLAGSGSQGQLRIMGLSNRINNEWGDSYTVVEVMIARSQNVANKVAY